jgi:DNA invertase Pin-like site-specific DNA recombinase
MSQEKTKVYIYTRVSTTMQIDGYSLDAQKARMKAYADFNNYQNTRMQASRANPLKAVLLSAG